MLSFLGVFLAGHLRATLFFVAISLLYPVRPLLPYRAEHPFLDLFSEK